MKRRSLAIGCLSAWLFPCVLHGQVPGYAVRIPHTEMTATSFDSYSPNAPDRAIDDSLTTYWETRNATMGNNWIQLDLGRVRAIAAIEVYASSYWINGYRVFVSNNPDSDWSDANPDNWGTPAATGNLTNSTAYHPIALAGAPVARYLRLQATSRHTAGRTYVHDLRVSEVAFSLTHPVTGSAQFTGQSLVNVIGLPALGSAYDEIIIGASPTLPVSDWTAFDPQSPPATVSLEEHFATPLSEGFYTLYAWFRDTAVTDPLPPVVAQARTIYTEAAPTATAVATLSVATYAGQPYTLGGTHIDAGSSGGSITVNGTLYNLGSSLQVSTGGAPAATVSLSLAGSPHAVTLTAMNLAGNTAAAPATTVTVSDGGGSTTTANVTWSGGAGALNPEWFRGQNWVDGAAPANPTTGRIQYAATGDAIAGRVETDRTVGSVRVTVAGTHTIDLGGNTLTVAGAWHQGDAASTKYVRNGTLRIGNDGTSGSMTVSRSQDTMRLFLQQNTVLDTYNVSSITIGGWGGQEKFVDLSAATVAGGIFETGSLNHTHRGRLILGDATLSGIVVRNALTLNGAGTPMIGKADDILPANVNLTFGVDAGTRASVQIAHTESNSAGQLRARSGGALTGWIGLMEVGCSHGNGVLLLAPMASVAVNAQTLRVGANRASPPPTDAPSGIVSLPPGAFTAGNVTIGGETLGYGRLELNRTMMTVSGGLTVKPTGVITNNVGADPIGLDIEGTFIDDGGRIHVNFLAAPTESVHWAIRISGNAHSALSGMIGSGRLTWSYDAGDPGFEDKSFRAFFDEVADKTYFAVTGFVEPEPVAVARNLTFEALPAVPVRVSVNEVDNGSNDPGGRPFRLTLSHGVQVDVTELEFTGYGVYENVQLKITILDENDDPTDKFATDTCSITLAAVADPVTTAVTWTGDGPTALMDRREWFWGKNWAGLAAPALVTSAAINFDTRGQTVTGVIETDRTIGGLTVLNSSTHTLDLGGNRLTVVGPWNQGTSGMSDTFNVENGTLQMGTAETAVNILLNSNQGTSILRLRNGAVLHTRNVNSLTLGEWGNQERALDLEAATVQGGVLAVNALSLTYRGRIRLGDSSLSGISVRSALTMQGGTPVYIGKSTDEKLPANVDLALGIDAANRATVTVSIGNLIVRSGGMLSAWIGSMTLTGGVVDFSAMEGGTVDAATVSVGAGGESCTLGLPSGSAAFGALSVGGAGAGPSRLLLNRTRATVAGNASFGASANATINLGALEGGLAVAGTVSIDPSSTIHIHFQEDPTHGNLHYGLKLAGDHVQTLTNLRLAGRLTWNDTAMRRKADIFPRGDGYTYVAVSPASGTVLLLR